MKTFHELAVGIKDAYEAGGCVPKNPPLLAKEGGGGGDKGKAEATGGGADSAANAGGDSGVDSNEGDNKDDSTTSTTKAFAGSNNNNNYVNSMPQLTESEWEHQRILFEFMGNLDFLLALVDEVAIDTATRGALKVRVFYLGFYFFAWCIGKEGLRV